MNGSNDYAPHPPEFERFLYASVGEDRNGYVVTVLSFLARLGLDPWVETAELATQGRDAGCKRLALLLSTFRDVPALANDHRRVARELSFLLPEIRPTQFLKTAGTKITEGRLGFTGTVWAILAIAFILLQMLFTGVSGSGE